ncbi:MAG: hypothetical protein AB7E66_05820 [Parvibaculaceae bacterium]
MNAVCFGFLVFFQCQGVPQAAADSFCVTATLINPAREDTAETKRQVRAHNAKFRRLCGSKREPSK